MMKRLLAFIFFSLTAGSAFSQDMPPLPPLPNQSQAAPASPGAAGPALPPLPDQSTAASPNANPSLPPLPGQSQGVSASLSTDGSQASTILTAPEAPPAAPATQEQSAQPPVPASPEQAAPSPTPAAEMTQPAVKKAGKKQSKPWQVSKYRPNVIFGGWVKAKGGNESSRIAWTSQEVLNALLFKKYRLIGPEEGKAEEGSYDGQEGRQWRQFTFKAPQSKLTVQVYVRPIGRKVWLRVGPAEAVAPAATSLAQARKMREADLAALHLIQRKFGHRLAPHMVKASWEAPYDYSHETADE